jgi:hypothetical protein
MTIRSAVMGRARELADKGDPEDVAKHYIFNSAGNFTIGILCLWVKS